MENTGGNASLINGKNERHNRSIHVIVRSDLADSNQHEKIWCCAAETSAEVYLCKLHSALESTSSHFPWYVNNTNIHELRVFEFYIYPTNSFLEKLDNRTQEVLLMIYTNSIDTMKLWDPYPEKIKYCSSAKIFKHKNKFSKVWSPGYELMTGTNITTLPTLKLTSQTIPS